MSDRLTAAERAYFRLLREQVKAQQEANRIALKMARTRATRDVLASVAQASATEPMWAHMAAGVVGATLATFGGLSSRAMHTATDRMRDGAAKSILKPGTTLGQSPFETLGEGMMALVGAKAAGQVVVDLAKAIRGEGARSSSLAFDLAEGSDVALAQASQAPFLPFVPPPRGGGGKPVRAPQGTPQRAPPIPPLMWDSPELAQPQAVPQGILVSDPVPQGAGQGEPNPVPVAQPTASPSWAPVAAGAAASAAAGFAGGAAGRKLAENWNRRAPKGSAPPRSTMPAERAPPKGPPIERSPLVRVAPTEKFLKSVAAVPETVYAQAIYPALNRLTGGRLERIARDGKGGML